MRCCLVACFEDVGDIWGYLGAFIGLWCLGTGQYHEHQYSSSRGGTRTDDYSPPANAMVLTEMAHYPDNLTPKRGIFNNDSQKNKPEHGIVAQVVTIPDNLNSLRPTRRRDLVWELDPAPNPALELGSEIFEILRTRVWKRCFSTSLLTTIDCPSRH